MRSVVAAAPPKVTELVPSRSAPLIVTVVPPSADPLVGVSDRIFGGCANAKFRTDVPCPPVVVTDIFTEPAGWAFVNAVICVVLVTRKLAAVVVPNWTFEAPPNPVPLMVTVVPPAIGPVTGVKSVMVGGATTR